jgi:hypothetical protein
MHNELKDIYEAFDGKLVGSFPMKKHVCEVVTKLPEEIIDFVTKNCWFIGSYEDAWAFTFTGNDLKDQHLVFLSDELLLQDISQIHYSIAHEIGHVILNHRNSTLVKQSKSEIALQEKKADEFAKKYIL